MPEDTSYLKLYVIESRENHENLVRNLLSLEGSEGREVIDEIFRSAHTLKGMSASMGFGKMEHLCHSMEDVFSLLRTGSIRPCREMIDDLLACADYIERALREIETNGKETLPAPADLIARMGSWSSCTQKDGDPAIQAQKQKPTVPEGGERARDPAGASGGNERKCGGSLYRVHVQLEAACSAKYLRGMLLLQNLESLGRIRECDPPREAVEDESFAGEFTLLLESDAGREAVETAARGVDVARCEISLQEGSGEEAPVPEHAGLPAPGRVQPAASGEGARGTGAREIRHLRVDLHRLDQAMNLVEDLVINEGRIRQIASKYGLKELDEALAMIGRSISDLHDLMMKIRMIPLSHIFNRFPRAVRDVARHDGKEVDLQITGGEVEMDRSVMDGLNDPLLHLIRNAVNHGIEPPDVRRKIGKNPRGTIRLSARTDRDNVVIEVEDDGGGIDCDRVKAKALERGLITEEAAGRISQEEILDLLFLPGFSTAERVTDISGRGVGLDVVRRTVEAMKGSIRIETGKGRGTKFQLILPPTMAIVDVLIVRIDGRRCAIPVHNVVEVASMKRSMIRRVARREVVVFRDDVLPLHRLHEMFGGTDTGEILFVLQGSEKRFCITVGEVEGQQQVVIKPLNTLFGRCPGIGGFTIPGDGEAIPVLDVNSLVQGGST